MRKLRWGIASIWVIACLAVFVPAGAGLRWHRYVGSPLPGATAFRAALPPTDDVELDYEVNRLGLANPSFADARDGRISRSLKVIGLVVDGQAYAYSVGAMSFPPRRQARADLRETARRHVINQLLGTTAVSVTYCDMSMCARAFRVDNQERELPLTVGGVTNGKMVLYYNGKKYLQMSKRIPLTECPVQVTNWGDWLADHPNSQIYLGG